MAALTDILVVSHATVRFGQVDALVDASLTAAKGEILAVLGPSGCGKTTLLRCIAGFQRLHDGEVAVGGQVLESPTVHVPPHRRAVGMVFQDFALFPHLSVEDNIAYGLPRGAGRSARVAELLSMAGVSTLSGRYPHQLSAGQQQRVAILRSLAPGPSLILLDEPFSNLDPETHATLRTQVAALLRENGVTAVLVTHDRADAFAVADRVAVMETGRVLEIAPPPDLYFRPGSLAVARAVGSVQLLPGMVTGNRIVTAIGDLDCPPGSANGPANALVRPEWIVPSESGITASLVESRIEGATCRSVLRLPGGETVEMVATSGNPPPQGAIAVSVAIPVPVFPMP